jgi:hypothetical protein
MTSRDVLSDILRQGAQQMLAMAVENEVGEYIGEYQHVRDAKQAERAGSVLSLQTT